MPRLPSIPPPALVGRERELERMERALESVAVGLIIGVPGVGKSSLLAACANRAARPALTFVVRAGQSMSDVVDDVRRALAKGRIRQALSDEERLLDLVSRLEKSETLLVLDDLHHLGSAAHALLASLGGALENARVIAASRERPLESARDPLRFELRLENLDETGARELWLLLDDLYGQSGGFERAWARTRGNPLMLRRAHAGDLDSEDPIGAALEKLSKDERFIARALALVQMPLSRAAAARLLPDARAVEALRSLTRRLIVVVDGSGAATLHDSFREPLSAAASALERRRVHSALADVLMASESELVTRVREVSRHLREAERYDDLLNYLSEHAKALVREGASRELAQALESIPESHKTPESETMRARALSRALDLHRAFAVLEAVIRERGVTDREVVLTFARVATLMGRLELAESTLAPLLGEKNDDEEHRLRLLTAYSLLATHRGRGDEVRRRLASAETSAPNALARAILSGYRAVSLWLDERDDEAVEIVPKTRALGAEVLARAPSVRAAVGLPYGLAASLARVGRIAEAEALLEEARRASALEEDALLALELRLVAGEVSLQKDERLTALAEFEATASGFARGGYLLAELWSNVFRARVLRLLGRRQAAERVEHATESMASEHGVEAVLAALERSRDPKRVLIRSPVRQSALEALSRAAKGDGASIARLRNSLGDALAAPGFALDRALFALAEALAAEARGNSNEAETARQRALALAEAENVDIDALHALMPALGSLRVVSAAGRQISTNVELGDRGTVLDARDHTLRTGDRVISLKNRHVVRRMLYGFAREPGRALSKERLAELAWGVEYDPRVHDGALKVNILRLRALLRDTGLAVDLDVEGYRSSFPADFVFVEPLARE